jgi:KipI family sensor histidine kinase inhibitor
VSPAGARPVARFGDGALVAAVGSVGEAHALAAAVSGVGWHGVEDVVVGYRSVTVVSDPSVADVAGMEEELSQLAAAPRPTTAPRRVDIPVCFDGPDLEEVAALAAMSHDAVVGHLTAAALAVAFVGFLPGFAYLDGLPGALAAVPRRPTPRTAVAAGSVALGGGFAGVYPQASPGGWHLVGRTGFGLFDPDTPPFAVLAPGDSVRLQPVQDPGTVTARSRGVLRSAGPRTVVVEAPGLLSMVQDLGRVGVARWGVPRGGAADPFALRSANRLVGNRDGDGALEVTALGPRLRFGDAAHVAVVGGAEVSIDGRGIEVDTVVPVAPGQELSVRTTLDGLRCYVAVSGGLEVPPLFGSRSSDVLTGLGAGPLRAGDVLGIGSPTRPRGRIVRGGPGGTGRGPCVLRVIPGPDDLGADGAARLSDATWEVGTASDRMGVRLEGDEPLRGRGAGVDSRAMVTGAVQVPPDGRPVVLQCDHATVGGYPVPATVVRADLGLLGQLRPGDAVRFEPIDPTGADRARARLERALEGAVVGWFPVRSD